MLKGILNKKADDDATSRGGGNKNVIFLSCIEIKNGYLVTISVTRFGNLLDFGPLFKAFGNN